MATLVLSHIIVRISDFCIQLIINKSYYIHYTVIVKRHKPDKTVILLTLKSRNLVTRF